eukprot:4543663-Ditylum_brightwellii.AAC.1
MVCKKSSSQRKSQTPVAKEGDVKVKVTINNMEESSATMSMAVMNGFTDVGVFDDKREKTPPDNCVALFDPNKMLQNKNVQVENEEDNEENNYPLGCANLVAFESKLNTHFITYFEQQDVDTILRSLHSFNNALNKRSFKSGMLRNIQQRLCHHVNDIVTDETEVDKFEEDELGN